MIHAIRITPISALTGGASSGVVRPCASRLDKGADEDRGGAYYVNNKHAPPVIEL